MESQKLTELFKRYVNNACSPQELELLMIHFHTDQETLLTELVASELDKDIQLSDAEELKFQVSVDRVHDHLKREISKDISRKAKQVASVRLWSRISVAAAIIIVVGAGLFYFGSRNGIFNQGQDHLAYKNDIAPGKIGATLTLGNGKKIRLSDAVNGELAREAGVSVRKSKDGEVVYEIASSQNQDSRYHTLTTAKGETYVLVLPDRSTVWMNAASSLTYSTSLNDHGKRIVKLGGEAYFEITKDKSRPFVVETSHQQVQVLGTHFNINAYDDEGSVKTTLLEGSVLVNDVTLKPGQQSSVSAESIKVTQADVESVMAWKNGQFILLGETLESAMRQVARWYNIQVIYTEGAPREMKLLGYVSRGRSISAVLELMERTGKVTFDIEGKVVTVKGK